MMKDTWTDQAAKITLDGDVLTITLKYPNAEAAQRGTQELLEAYERGDEILIELRKPVRILS